jgi:S-adenosylmethionine synthetase
VIIRGWRAVEGARRKLIEHLDLRRPIYRVTAAYGHFGRSEPSFTWESIRPAEALRRAAGL